MLKALRAGEGDKAAGILRKHLATTERIVQQGIAETK
jgi:DNA-binding GntR family transcriptional regulator